MTIRFFSFLLVLALCAVAAGSVVLAQGDAAADPGARAEAAFQEGRYDEAIELYTEMLETAPRDPFVLSRLARVLSWEDRLDESIEVYRRLLVLNPEDNDVRAAMARVYGWDGRYGEAEEAWHEVIRRDPGNAEYRIGLAELLGWQGRYDESRAIYQELIDQKDHAIEAGVGMGDVASWQGKLAEATRWYRRVLAADEDNEKAAVGLARVYHWQGLDRAALNQAESAVERFPKSREALKIHEEIRDSLRPVLTPTFDRTLDNDTNDLKVSRLAFSMHTDPQTSLTILLAHHDASFRCRSQKTGAADDLCPSVISSVSPPKESTIATTDAQQVAGLYSTRIGTFLTLDGRLGAEKMNRFDGGSRTSLSGAAMASVTPEENWGVSGGLTREALTDTARLIHNNVHVDAVTANAWWRFAEHWTLRGGAQRGSFSDGNDRNVGSGSLEYRFFIPHPRLTLGVATRYVAYANPEDLPRVPVGYFSPDSLWSYVATASLADSFWQKRIYWAADLQAGQQDITEDGDRNDDLFSWNLLLGWNVTDDVAAEAHFGRSDYAQQTASGFESEHYGFLVRIRM